jgi:hypothetical protein
MMMQEHGPALAALEPLLGEWTVEAKGPGGKPWPGEGRASFEWHASGAYLVQRTGIDAEGAPDSLAIIGCDEANGTYVQLYSDERGVCRIYEMHVDGREWTLAREGDPFPQRFTGILSEDGSTISGTWEKAEDGTNYVLDFYLDYRRVSPKPSRRSSG